MGEYAIKMPDIGEGIAEAELVEWYVGVGDAIGADEPLADVMTDKATVQIPSPVTGTVLSFGVEPGEVISVGSELVRLSVEGRGNVSSSAPRKDEQAAPDPGATETEPPVNPQPGPSAPEAQEPEPGLGITEPEPPAPPVSPVEPDAPGSAIAAEAPGSGSKALAAPAVRARAEALGLDLADVAGSGPDGRVTHADLDARLGGSAVGSAGGGVRRTGEEQIPVIGLRRMISKRMQESMQQIPHITIVEEIDVTELETLRTKMNAGGAERGRPKLTVLPFLMRAVVRAVEDQPALNAHYDDTADVITRYSAVHLGIATQSPDGLKVPVVRHAEALDVWAAAAQLAELSGAAKDGRATREQLMGSTITITSLGPLGAIASTPIINRPEVAIVGVNRMAIRPLWNGSAFVPRTVMNLSCSFDHRVIDGWDAAVFVARLKELLETPALLFTS